jgi:hypothetical protein
MELMPVTHVAEPAPALKDARPPRLSAERCRALLARASTGHMALSQGALPLVVPVTCALVGEQLLVRAGLWLIGKAPLQPGIVAFETGGTAIGDGSVWEVMVQGRAEVLDETTVPKGPPPLPSVEPGLTTALRISLELLTGWQYRGPGTTEPRAATTNRPGNDQPARQRPTGQATTNRPGNDQPARQRPTGQ